MDSNHPTVQAYLARVAAAAPALSQPPSSGKYRQANWHACDPAPSRRGSTTWWTFYMTGFARPEGVRTLLGDFVLSTKEAEVVFALAALHVLSSPKHPAHWAFWGRKHAGYVLQAVYKISRKSTVISPSFRRLF